MNERGLVEVPENAVRSESLAFGLGAAQLGILGGAVGLGAVANLLPLWLPAKVVVILVGVAPVVLVAILPIRGEPAYRWLIRAVRFARGRRTWRLGLDAPDKRQISAGVQGELGTGDDLAPLDRANDRLPESSEAAQDRGDLAPRAKERKPMAEQTVHLRVVGSEEDRSSGSGLPDDNEEAPERPLLVPHVLPGLRLVCLLSFAGGVGKTTLAVEIATLIAARARIRTIEGDEQPVRVLVLDAARMTSAVGLRLGLEPAALSAAWSHRLWRDPGAVGELAKPTRWRVEVVTLPPHPALGERDGHAGDPECAVFGVLEADALLEGAQAAGYHLVVADLGGVLEDGHRQLIDQADLVLGVVRPTIESLPDIFRLATVLRGLGMGRKLGFVANGADDDTEIGRIAREVGAPLLGRIAPHPAFTAAADRGEPAWSLAPALASDIASVARAAWPLLGEGAAKVRGRRSLLRAARTGPLADRVGDQ